MSDSQTGLIYRGPIYGGSGYADVSVGVLMALHAIIKKTRKTPKAAELKATLVKVDVLSAALLWALTAKPPRAGPAISMVTVLPTWIQLVPSTL